MYLPTDETATYLMKIYIASAERLPRYRLKAAVTVIP